MLHMVEVVEQEILEESIHTLVVVDLEMLILDKYFGMKLQSQTVVLVVLGVMVVVIQMHQMSQQDCTLLMIQTTT